MRLFRSAGAHHETWRPIHDIFEKVRKEIDDSLADAKIETRLAEYV